jgi:hypothetical protein
MGWVVSVTPRPRFSAWERTPGTHCTGGWVDLRVGLDTEVRGKISCLCRGSNLDHPIVQPVARHYTELPGSRVNICLPEIRRKSGSNFRQVGVYNWKVTWKGSLLTWLVLASYNRRFNGHKLVVAHFDVLGSNEELATMMHPSTRV